MQILHLTLDQPQDEPHVSVFPRFPVQTDWPLVSHSPPRAVLSTPSLVSSVKVLSATWGQYRARKQFREPAGVWGGTLYYKMEI